MVAQQDFDACKNVDVWLKLPPRDYSRFDDQVHVHGAKVAKLGELIEYHENKFFIPEAEDYIDPIDDRVYRFRDDLQVLGQYGICDAIAELVTKGVYPKRYHAYVHDIVKEDKEDSPHPFRFLSAPKNHVQEGIPDRAVIEYLLTSVVEKPKPPSLVTMHIDPMGSLCEVYFRGHRHFKEEFGKPVDQIKVSSRSGRRSTMSSIVNSSSSTKSHQAKIKEPAASVQVKSDASVEIKPVASVSSRSSQKSKKIGGFLKPYRVPSSLKPVQSSKLPFGPEWHCFRVEPARPKVPIDIATNSISPWRANKPDEDALVESKPLPAPAQFMDVESYMNHIHTRPYDKDKMEKVLTQSFPAFDPPSAGTSTKDYLFPYLESVDTKFAAVGIFTPPLQPLSANNKYGSWYACLNQLSQDNCTNHYKTVIIQCLKHPKTKLINESIIGSILMNCNDGYEALYMMAKIGGHPHLQDMIEHHLPSIQTRDVSIIAYLGKWRSFLYKAFLNGVPYLQWYWLDIFLKNMHPATTDGSDFP